MKYHIVTYGCQMNKSDSERIASALEKTGYQSASKINEADLIVVNMCSVRQSAVDRIFGLGQKFADLKEKNLKLKTILTGCVLKKDREKFRTKFDFILNIDDLQNLPKIIKKKHYAISSHGVLPCSRLSAIIPISRGCDNFCSYCVVPFTRGRLICRSHKEILKEAKNSVKKGAKEIWLLGQNVNAYQTKADKSINFAKLLKTVNDIPGDFWLRFTSPNPADFSDELIETMAKCEKITPYLNLPVQSGDDEILRKMKRRYTANQYRRLVKNIKASFKKYRENLEKEISLSTDIIVGYPGETKKRFENTVRLLKEIKYDMAYIAKYSPRPQTAASKLNDNVSPKEKERRWKILTETLKKTALENNKKYIGKEIEVLVEKSKNGFLFGKSRHYKTVKLKGSENLIGNFAEIKIVNALSWGLKGELI